MVATIFLKDSNGDTKQEKTLCDRCMLIYFTDMAFEDGKEADAEFLAMAREELPKLREEVKALWRTLNDTREAVKKISNDLAGVPKGKP